MDIRGWPLDKIMQLPDCCFGRRWPVIFSRFGDEQIANFYISELALPDVAVLWELKVFLRIAADATTEPAAAFYIKLGDQLPANAAEFTALPDMIPGLDERTAIGGIVRTGVHLVNLRLPIFAQGRRVVLYVVTVLPSKDELTASFVFSSVPTEVPDCLLSAHL